MTTKSALIVGAGLTGISTAEWLRRSGWMTTLVDPVLPGDSTQASYGNAGLLARTSVMPVASPSLVRKAPAMLLDPDSPLFMRWQYLPRLIPWLIPFLRNANAKRIHEISEALSAMTFDAIEQHMMLARGTPAEAFIRTGEFINLYRSKSDYETDTLGAKIRDRYNLVPEELSRANLVERDPFIGPNYTFGTLYRDYSWLGSPDGYAHALFSHYRTQGGQFRQQSVVAIGPGENPTITLDGGEKIGASKVILASGAWSSKLAKSIGIRMLLEAERGYHVTMKAPNVPTPGPYMVTDSKFVLTPMDGCLRAAGVVEFGGVYASASEAPVKMITKALKRVYPKLTFVSSTSWMGRRPTTPDSLPVIGESARAPNIIHAYGGQHVGVTIAPKIGRLIAQILAGDPANIDMTPYRVDRF